MTNEAFFPGGYLLNPFEHGVRRELPLIVRNNHLGCAAPGDDVVEFADDPAARQRDIRNGAETFLGDVINNVQHTEPAVSRPGSADSPGVPNFQL